jgi:hypothetical protein
MLIYFALLLVVTLSVYLSQKTSNAAARFFLYFVTFASLVLVSGLRDASVGTDAGSYVWTFQSISSLSDVRNASGEPGVPLLAWFGKLIYDNYVTLFTLVATVVALCFLTGIRRLSLNPVVSVFVLLTAGIFYFSFNGMRQGVAIAVLFLAIPFIYYRKLWAFLVCIAVACFFHISAIMALPVYFIVPRKNDFKYNALMFGVVVVSVLFFSELVALAGRLNARYLEYGAAVGQLSHGLAYAASVVGIGLFFLYFRRYVEQHRDWYDLLLNLYLLGVVVTVVAVVRTTYVSGVMRMNAYFITPQILLWPMVFANLQGSRHRDLVRFAFVVLFLVYHGILLARFSNLVPYSFNPLVRNGFRLLF